MNPASERVQAYLRSVGVNSEVRDMPGTTKTAKDAAAAVGCAVAQIAKSIVFRMAESGRAVLVIASGVNRVNEQRMAELIGERIEKATPEFVREATGFVIGGVPPVGHSTAIETWMDQDLLQFEQIWAAAGTPFSLFSIGPGELRKITGAKVQVIS